MDEKINNTVQPGTPELIQVLRKKIDKLEAEKLGLHNEIEARKLSQVGLREGQDFLQEILSSQGETFVLVFDENGVINFAWGPVKLEKRYQIKFTDYIGKYPSEFLKQYPESFKKEILQQVFSNGQVTRRELGVEIDSGRVTWDISLSPVLDENKQVSAVVAAVRDISELKYAEEALRDSEEKYHSLFENMSNGIAYHKIILDATGKPLDYEFIDINPSFTELTGLTRKMVINKRVTEIIPGIRDDPADWIGRYGKVALFQKTISFEDYSEGLDKWFNINAYSPENGFFVATFEDISERKKSEEKLRQSEEKFRLTFENSADAIVWVDIESKLLINCNKACEILLEKSRQEIVGMIHTSLHPPEKKEFHFENLNKVIKSNKTSDTEGQVITKSGKIIPVRITASQFTIDGKEIIQGIFRDISQQKKIQRTLLEQQNELEEMVKERTSELIEANQRLIKEASERKQKEEELSRFFDLSVDMISIGDINGRFKRINSACSKILGFNEEEMLDRPYIDFVHPEDKEKTMKVINEELLSGKTVSLFENRFICKDGSFIFLEWTSRPILEEGITFSIARDITGRKIAERILRQQAQIIEQIHDSVVITDLDGFITGWNNGAEVLFGYSFEEILGKHISFLYPEDEHDYLQNQIVIPLKNKGYHEVEPKMQKKTGEIFHAHLSLSLLKDENGKPYGMIGYSIDITERKLVEKEISEKNELLETIFSNTPFHIAYLDKNFNFIKVNEQYAKANDKTPKDLIGKNHFELYPHEENVLIFKEVLKSCKSYFAYAQPFEYKDHPDRGVFYYDWSLHPVRNTNGDVENLILSVVDVTEKIKAKNELKLKDQEIQFSLTGYAICDLKGKLNYVNQSFLDMWGYNSEKEVLGKSVIEFWENEEESLEVISELKKKGRWEGEITAKKKGGSSFIALTQANIVYGKKNKPIYMTASFMDISDYKLVEKLELINEELKKEIAQHKLTGEALRESEQKYRETIDLLPEVICETDIQGNILFVNQIGMKLFGYSEEELKTGLNILQILAPKEREEAFSKVLRILRGENLPSEEYTGLKKDGTVFPILIHSDRVTRDGKTVGIRAIIIDMTLKKQTENKLRESDRNFRDILENSQNIIYKFNVQTRSYDYVSPSIEKVLGWTADEYSLRKISQAKNMVHPHDFEKGKENRINLLNATDKMEFTREMDIRLKHKNGEYRWFRDYSTVIKDSEGIPLYTISYLVDINEQKRTEEELKESEQKFRSISEQSLMGIVIVQDGVIKYANNAFSLVIGYPPDVIHNWAPNTMFDFVHPDDRKFLIKQAQKKQTGFIEGILSHYPVRFFAKSGEIRWIEITSKTITYSGKNADLVMLMDITDRKKAEDALKESGDVMRSLLENSPDFILMLDQAGIVQFINHPIPGVNSDTTDFKSIYGFINTEYHEILRNSISQVFETGKTESIKLIIHDKNGFEISYEVRFGIIRQDWKSVGVILILTDITEREKIQADLVESEKFFSQVVETINEGLGIVDENNCLTYVNNKFCEMLQYSMSEILGRKLTDFMDENGLITFQNQIGLRQKGMHTQYENYYIKKNGEKLQAIVSPTPLFFPNGKFKGSMAIITDITERKMAEEKLKESEENYRTLFRELQKKNMEIGYILKNLPIVMWSTDKEGIFTFSEGKGLAALGLKSGEIVGKSVFEFYKDFPDIMGYNRRALSGESLNCPVEIRNKQYESYYEPLRNEDNELIGMLGLAIEISHRENLKEFT